jgi:hypothetical protein
MWLFIGVDADWDNIAFGKLEQRCFLGGTNSCFRILQDLLDWKDLQVVKNKRSQKPERERMRQASLRIASLAETCQVSVSIPGHRVLLTDPYFTGHVWPNAASPASIGTCKIHRNQHNR